MNKKLQLAPMQAMTDIIFMNTYHKVFGGFDQMMAPYLLASTKSPVKIGRIRKMFGDVNPDINFIPQLLSNEAKGFLHYANVLSDAGFKEVNWNLGCPYIFVAKKKRGSGLLPYPDMIRNILDDIMTQVKIKVSVKMRLGFHTDEEILPLIDILNDYQLKEVIIHPRTGRQMYEGKADVDAFSELYKQFKMPVVYNGDILEKEHADSIGVKCPEVSGYMIGRGAFINPFITNQIKGNSLSENEKRIKYKEFYYTLHEFYKQKTMNDKFFLHRMKELWQYFHRTFVNGEELFAKIRKIEDVENFEKEVSEIVASCEFAF